MTNPSAGSFSNWSRRMLVREWWYLYLAYLKTPASATKKQLDAICAECERREIVKPGLPMPRDEAEDLASEVDELKAKNVAR